jgi:hypothetical protein
MVALCVSCNNAVYKGLWQSQPLQVKSSSPEPSNSYKFYDGEIGLYYTISNDLDNLYISIKTNSQQTQTRILRSGLQICIDTSGKYNEQTKIVFPFAVMQKKKDASNDDSYVNRQSSGRGRGQSMGSKPESLISLKNKFRDGNKLMHLIGFKTPIGGIVTLPNDYGIKMNITWDSSNAMIYQASIPFVTFYKKSLLTTDSSKVFAITMNLTGLPTPAGMRPIGGMGGSGMSMGMGGMGGMGMGFGMRIPLGGNPNGMGNSGYQQNTTIKMKIKLAVKPSADSGLPR